jgi:sugar transferase (PEP-CTERM/EpsH1 system associated)
MSEILFLAHRMPFPPDRGDKIRSHHLLRAIAALAPVHVACFGETDDDMAHEKELAMVAASHCLVRRTRSVSVAAIEALANGKPVSLTAFASHRIQRYIEKVLATRPISAIFVFSGQMAQYVPARFEGTFAMDFVDVDSAKFGAYRAGASLPAKLMYWREERLLRRFEERIARRATTSLLVTPEEAVVFVSRLKDPSRANVAALPNGIDATYYDPHGVSPAQDMLTGGPQIVFTGQMDYPPNVAAVTTFARSVMPRIRAVMPHARFHVVGRAPTPAVVALNGRDGCNVTGVVADVRPWLAGADLVVAPLEIARGVQNKVLEAMAMARPVLATTAAATGIPARDGVEIAVADGADHLAVRALELLRDPEMGMHMGMAARLMVVQRCSWAGVLAPLPHLLGLDGGRGTEPVAVRAGFGRRNAA